MNAALIKRRQLNRRFRSVEKLIYQTVGIVQKEMGGDFEELKSEAFVIFVQADESYDPNQSEYTTWIRFKVYHKLYNFRKKEMRAKRIRPEDYNKTALHDNLGEILADLPNDARTIVDLFLQTPQELMDLFELSGGNVKDVMSVTAGYLKSFGWSRRRICTAYKQIGKAVWSN